MKPWHYLAAAAVVLLLARRKKAPQMIITAEEVAQWERDHGEWQGPPLPDGYTPGGMPGWNTEKQWQDADGVWHDN